MLQFQSRMVREGIYSHYKMPVQIGKHIILPDFPLLLAPMEDVSDPPFRYVCKKYGADLMFSEFISSESAARLLPRLKSLWRCVALLDS